MHVTLAKIIIITVVTTNPYKHTVFLQMKKKHRLLVHLILFGL